jgi:hypothetical protein
VLTTPARIAISKNLSRVIVSLLSSGNPVG